MIIDNDEFFIAHSSVLSYARAALNLGLDSFRAIFVDSIDASWSLNIMVPSRPTEDEASFAEIEATPIAPPYRLSCRELDTLTLVAAGLSNKEIAARLGISPKTVATHVERILTKLDHSTRAGAAAAAAEQGLLRLPVPGGGYGLTGLSVGLVDEAANRGVGESLRRKAKQRYYARPSPAPIVLGSALPLIGVAASDGEDMGRGAALAVTAINKRGGVAGRFIQHRIAPYDPMRPETLLAALDSIHGVDAATCGYIYDPQAIPDVVHRAACLGAPFIHTLSARASLESVKREPELLGAVFQACSPEDVYGQGFLRFLTECSDAFPLFRGKIAFIDMGEAHVGKIPYDVWSRGEALGLTVLPIKAGSSIHGWESAATEVTRANVDIVYVSCFVEGYLLAFLNQLAQNPKRPFVYSLYVPSSAGFITRAGPVAEGLLWATTVGVYSDHFGSNFVRRFREFHAVAPGRANVGVHYDIVNLLAQAWVNARDVRSIDDVLGSLRSIVHRGVTGSYFLGTPGQSGQGFPDECADASLAQAHLVFQIQDNEHRIIGPSGFAESKLAIP